jgi:membrane protein required for colicin V production
MNWIDISILIFLALGVFFGFQRGFIKSFTGFIGIGIAIWAGFNFSSFLEGYVDQQETIPDSLVNIVALLATVGLVYVGIKVVSKMLHSTVHTIGLGFFNRIGGALFGFLLYALSICAIFYFLMPFLNSIIQEETLKESLILPHLMNLVEVLKISFF